MSLDLWVGFQGEYNFRWQEPKIISMWFRKQYTKLSNAVIYSFYVHPTNFGLNTCYVPGTMLGSSSTELK